jgi:hypothetical protein
MTFPADQPVVSGQSDAVTAVAGHRPAALTDFVGTIAVTLVRDGHRHCLIGDGAAHRVPSDSIRKTLVRTTRTSGSGPSPTAAAARSSLRPPQLSNHIELGGGRCADHAGS